MKKRWIAVVCAVALTLGLGGALATHANAASHTFQVGYAKVSINPYKPHKLATGETAIGSTTATHVEYVADSTEKALFVYDSAEQFYRPIKDGETGTHKRVVNTTEGQYAYEWYDSKGNRKYGEILSLPMAGSGYTMTRQSTTTLIDDNGDGKIDHNDGLSATCIAITDDQGDTVLLFSADLINGDQILVDAVRERVVAGLAKQGVTIPAENIQFQGTHTHNGVDLGKYSEKYYHPETGSLRHNSWELKDVSGKPTGELIYAFEGYDVFETYYPYLMQQLEDAAVSAVKEQAPATLSKGSIDAGNAAGKTMNGVRHYTRVTKDGELYVYGAHFNTDASFKDYNTTLGTYKLSAENDTMYCMEFTFENGSDPIAIINWRAHPNSNGTSGSGLRLNISSDYVGAMNQVLKDNHYRPFFMQGAAGNMAIGSEVDSWLTSGSYTKKEGNVDVDGRGLLGTDLKTNRYGKELGNVALKCLQDNMHVVKGGNDVKVENLTYFTPVKATETQLQYYAGLAAKAYYNASNTSSMFNYPADVKTKTINGQTLYSRLSAEEKAMADEFLAAGESFLVSSLYHAQHLESEYGRTGTQRVDLTACMLGSGIAFVTAPGEMYDRYNSSLKWDDLKNLTQAQAYAKMNEVNEWDKLWGSKVGGSYGVPFVMGYCNDAIGYLPASIAYEYNADASRLVTGSYEAHITAGKQGFSEKILDVYQQMLNSLVNTTVDTDIYQTGWCEACQKNVVWEAYSTTYNVEAAEQAPNGHYFLEDDLNLRVQTVTGKLCLDLRGHDYKATASRCFVVGTSSETGILNIFDTVGEGTMSGCSKTTHGAGATINVNAGSTLNIYGGTLYHRAHSTDENKVVEDVLRINGTCNIYGGTVQGGDQFTQSRAITVKTSGALNIYGGNIRAGEYEKNGQAVYAQGTVKISGNPCIEEMYVTNASRLKVDGLFHGDLDLVYPSALTAGQQVGAAVNSGKIFSGGITVQGTDYTLSVANGKVVTAEKDLQQCVCGENCQAMELTDAMWDTMGGALASGHYKLAEDLTTDIDPDGLFFEKNVCLDLNGHTLRCTSGRLYEIADDAFLRISDSSQANTGKIITAGLPEGVESNSGSVFMVHGYAELELKDIAFEMAQGAADTTKTWRGGYLFVNGILEAEGCSFTGGKVVANGDGTDGRGGNIYVASSGRAYLTDCIIRDGVANGGGNMYVFGKLYLRGNTQVLGGTADTGSCITVPSNATSQVYISGNAQVDELRFAGNSADALVVDGNFTGNVNLNLVAARKQVGEDIGNCTGSIHKGYFSVRGTALQVVAENGQLVLAEGIPVAQILDNKGNVTDFTSVQQAVNAYTSGTLALMSDVDSAVTIDKNITVDLNGYGFAPAVASGVVITCADSMTADYDVADGVYTKISAALAAQAQAAQGYLPYTHGDGSVSFHKVETRIESAYCRPGAAGIYYGSTFKGDQIIASLVDSFGVALSIVEDPKTDKGPSRYSRFTVFEKEQFEVNNTKEYASTVLVDILDSRLGVSANKANGETAIYGRSYIKLTDGSYIWSGSVKTPEGEGITLKWALEWTNDNWNSLSQLQKDGILELYGKFRGVLDKWDTGVIKSVYEAVTGTGEKVTIVPQNSTLEQRRQAVVDEMYNMMSMYWTPAQDVVYTHSGSSKGLESDLVNKPEYIVTLYAGRVYRGMPYAHGSGSSYSFLGQTIGVTTSGVPILDLTSEDLSGVSGYTAINRARLSNNCADSVCWAWGKVASSLKKTQTVDMTEANGFLKVGDYACDLTSYAGVSTKSICAENGKETMYKAYAQLQKGDAIVYHTGSAGHAIMITEVNVVYKNGAVDPDKSTVKYLDQGSSCEAAQTTVEDPVYGTVYICEELNKEHNFTWLYNMGCLPVTCKELRNTGALAAAKATASVQERTVSNMFEGTIDSNYRASSVTITITDEKGNKAQSATCYSVESEMYNFKLNRFNHPLEQAVMKGSLSVAELPAGKYTCTYTCQLSTGEILTVQSFTFTK